MCLLMNTYQYINPEKRPLSIIIRGVPYSISDDEAKSELLFRNFPIIKANRVLKKTYLEGSEERQKVSMPLSAVELTNNEQGKAIFSLDRLFFFSDICRTSTLVTNYTTMHQLAKVQSY